MRNFSKKDVAKGPFATPFLGAQDSIFNPLRTRASLENVDFAVGKIQRVSFGKHTPDRCLLKSDSRWSAQPLDATARSGNVKNGWQGQEMPDARYLSIKSSSGMGRNAMARNFGVPRIMGRNSHQSWNFCPSPHSSDPQIWIGIHGRNFGRPRIMARNFGIPTHAWVGFYTKLDIKGERAMDLHVLCRGTLGGLGVPFACWHSCCGREYPSPRAPRMPHAAPTINSTAGAAWALVSRRIQRLKSTKVSSQWSAPLVCERFNIFRN